MQTTKDKALLETWESTITGYLNALRLRTIKSKIMVFALLATFIPSLSMGWLSYVQNRRFLSEKITSELKEVTNQASRELELWLKERLYEVRVFSSSYVVSENLEKLFHKDGAYIENMVALRRVKDYLKSVQEKVVDYEELMVVDPQGRVVATSAKQTDAVEMPEGWLEKAEKDEPIIGTPYWDDVQKAGVIVIAEPIKTAHERFLGVMAAKVNFRTIGKTLKNYYLGEEGEIYVITRKGVVLVSSRPLEEPFMAAKLRPAPANDLFGHKGVVLEYVSYQHKWVVGTLKPVPKLDWGVVGEKDRKKAYVHIIRLRNLTLGLVAAVLCAIGLGAYLLGLTIVRPLDRLTKGAATVAGGDLEVDLPVLASGEVGYLTEVFNDMVSRLRKGREELDAINQTLREKNEELQLLSITDGLTGLYNRKHLMETLIAEVKRSKRHKHPFAVLMIDIDHFKKYNDTFGHLAGDDVLRKMATVFKKSVRECDYAARYGGEEFLVMLPETGAKDAAVVAERLRSMVENEKVGGDGGATVVTVSVGVAAFPEDGDDPESVVSRADTALYKAKTRGRNRVIIAGNGRKKKKKAAK
jgi:diguanylate cyclase (GGDEF)-like protein